ncbi:MAG: hypothetical protein ABSF94_02675 [Steroidobacteraceae bacterium]|jgi:hypothetical protein
MPNVRQNAARAHPRSVGDRTAQALGAAQDPARLHDLHEPRDLGSLRELNQRFLELDWTHAAFSGRIAALTPAQRAAAANCPYALFDLRLGDCDYWQLRLEQVHAWHVADRDAIGAELAEFMRLALFFAWYAASAARPSAKLVLSMHERTAAAFSRMTVTRIPDLVITESACLCARWSHCAEFWSALAQAAASGDAQRLKWVQLSGIQVAAAAQLPLRREPRAV